MSMAKGGETKLHGEKAIDTLCKNIEKQAVFSVMGYVEFSGSIIEK